MANNSLSLPFPYLPGEQRADSFEERAQQNMDALAVAVGGLFGGAANSIRVGHSAITGDGTDVTETVTVTHGLGKTPTVAIAAGGTSSAMLCTVLPTSIDTDSFDVTVRQVQGTPWPNGSVFVFFWIAIG